jgi:hypothetical protein
MQAPEKGDSYVSFRVNGHLEEIDCREQEE